MPAPLSGVSRCWKSSARWSSSACSARSCSRDSARPSPGIRRCGKSVTFTKTDGTQTTISCEDTGNKLLIDGQILLSDVASCRFTTNGAGPSYIGIVLTQQLAERQVTWTLSVAPRNTPLAKD